MKKRKHFVLTMLLLAFVVFFTGCGTDVASNTTTESESVASENDGKEAGSKNVELYFDKELPDVVMRINSQDITKKQLLSDYEQMKILYKSVGIDINSTEIRQIMQEALISNTISTVVLNQEADKAGIVIGDAEIKEKMEAVISQYPTEEQFKEMLTQLNISLEEFQEKIKNQLKVSKFMEKNVMALIESNSSLDFTDEEKEKMYTLFNSKVGGMPDYDEMKDEVDDILEDNKAQIIVSDYIQDLIDKSEIEIFLDLNI